MPESLSPIPLPHGRTGGITGALSVYFAGRTAGSTELGLTDWADWPAVVRSLDLSVTIDGATVPPDKVVVTSPVPDSDVWEAVFAPDTPWNAWVVDDRRGRPYTTLPERELHDDIVTAWADVGNTFTTTIPTVDDLRTVPSLVDLLADGGAGRERLAQARRFTQRLAGRATSPDAQGVEDLDFDQALALLGRHPHLLRLLGIVVDLQVDVPPSPGWVAVTTDIMTRPDNTVRELAPKVLVQDDFWPHGGFDQLVDDALLQVDVLAAAGHIAEFVRTFSNGDGLAPLPSLDESGLALTRSDAVAVLHDRAERMAEIERDIRDLREGDLDVWWLHGDDVVVGRRIDAATPSGPFRSLHQRHSPTGYAFPRNPNLQVTTPDDENWVSTMLGTEATNKASQQRARPVLHRWTGWSAAAPPPGLVLDPVTGAAVETPPNEPAAGPVQFRADYEAVPGSLPPLRYGVDYVMRARLVDISGVSLPVEDGGGRPQSPPPTTFGRWTTIASPTVVRRTPAPVPGVDDTPTQLVIRSEVDQDDGTVTSTDRLLFPPVGTQRLAERHGLPNGGAHEDAWTMLAERDGRSPTDDTTADPVTGERVVVGEVGAGKPGTDPVPGPEQVAVSYLPDPAGTGVGFTGVPGHDGTVAVEWAGPWPAVSTQRLVLAAGPAGTTMVDDDDAVEVQLPKAGVVDVEVACIVGSPFHDHFGVIAPMRADRNAAESAALDRELAAGRVWLVSARKTLTLVHAVRVPLTAPAVVALDARRRLAGRHTRLSGKLDADRASTRRVILRCTWVDPVDDPAEDGPREVAARAVIGKVGVDVEGNELVEVNDVAWRVDDTRHREVAVTAEAYSRFSRFFTEQLEVVLDDEPVVLDEHGVAPRSVRVRAGDTTFSADGDYVVDGTAGTLTRRRRGAIKPGTSVTVRFVPLPTSRTSDEHPTEPFVLSVANTVPPPPPDVLEVVPAFDRRRELSPRRQRARHDAAVVRVWIGRGWYASGADELLGVVVDPPSEDLPVTSAFGRDPLFRTGDPERLVVDGLPAATVVENGLVDPDGRIVDVAGHEVTWDPDSRRWFADVHLDAPEIPRPFLRLVLCRFQPTSVDGAHLSAPVVADPVRLGPTRTSSVRLDDDDATLVVRVVGLDHRGVPDPEDDKGRNHDRVTAWLERHDDAVTDPALGWGAIDGPIELTRRALGGGRARWTGRFPVPDPRGDERLRVRIEEEEPLQSGTALRTTVAWRPVFVETLPLPTASTRVR